MFEHKKALLLDMNGTFMFAEDRFSENEDYSQYYNTTGGKLAASEVNTIITNAYHYLDKRYPDIKYRHQFPSVETAIKQTCKHTLSASEMTCLVDTFAHHELGYIPDAYIDALFKLEEKFILAAVIDIWSPKQKWLQHFIQSGVWRLFSATSFSSDHGMVKPSPEPFANILKQLKLPREACLVVGDSIRRDLGGAVAAGIDCVLVGGKQDPKASACYQNLLALCTHKRV